MASPHRATAALLSYVSDEEVFLRGIPADSRACVVLHPPAELSAEVAAHLTELARERRQLHRKWYFGSWAALSVTIPLMIIPIVPAVPFYWCVALFRWSRSARSRLRVRQPVSLPCANNHHSFCCPQELLSHMGQQKGLAWVCPAGGLACSAGAGSTAQAMHAHTCMCWRRVLQSCSRSGCSWGRPRGGGCMRPAGCAAQCCRCSG